jgi:hypothetical protein
VDIGLLIVKKSSTHAICGNFVDETLMFACGKKLSFLPKNNINKRCTLSWWKKLNNCMFTTLTLCNSTITSIDLWMSKGVN